MISGYSYRESGFSQMPLTKSFEMLSPVKMGKSIKNIKEDGNPMDES